MITDNFSNQLIQFPEVEGLQLDHNKNSLTIYLNTQQPSDSLYSFINMSIHLDKKISNPVKQVYLEVVRKTKVIS